MRRLSRITVCGLCAAVLVLGACTDNTATPDDPRLDAELLDEVGAAVATLVGDGYQADELDVTVAEMVTWKDGALGCPEPDGVYTQALVPGYRIIISTPDGDVAFHGETGGEPLRCDDPEPPASHGT